MKYGRPVNHGDADGKRRMIDVVDLPETLPVWAEDADAWLSRMYQNQKAGWLAAGEWFVAVPNGVRPCAVHTGSDYTDPLSYLNPDGTGGDGLTTEQREALAQNS